MALIVVILNRQVGSGEEYQQPHEISVLHRRLMKRMDVDGREMQAAFRRQSDTNNRNNNDAVAAAAAAIINRTDAAATAATAKSPGQEPSEQVRINQSALSRWLTLSITDQCRRFG